MTIAILLAALVAMRVERQCWRFWRAQSIAVVPAGSRRDPVSLPRRDGLGSCTPTHGRSQGRPRLLRRA
jgi:hypothetical protein